MQKLLALSMKTILTCAMLLSFNNIAIANDNEVENDELSYTDELRKDAMDSAKESSPQALFQEEAEILSEEDKKALANAAKGNLGKDTVEKPSFEKPKLSKLPKPKLSQPNSN